MRGTFHFLGSFLLAAVAIALVVLSGREPSPKTTRTTIGSFASASTASEPIRPLWPLQPASEPERAALGERLFHDPRLSRDGTVSCASCHSLTLGGGDGRPKSVGVGGAPGKRNAPSIFNVALNVAQFWDGRASTLAEQIDGPLHDPAELGSSWPEVIARLSAIPEYRERFLALYPQGIDVASVKDALVRYQQTLVTPNAPFDRYLLGEHDAIDDTARAGYERFKAYGCVSCHQGMNIGGNMFQRFGIMGDYFADRGDEPAEVDYGRYQVTGLDADRYVFKVPSLRNVALTAPYFHDGSVATLEEAVAIMGRYQLGRTLSAEDVTLIVAFLRTLTGEIPDGRWVVAQP